VSAVRTILGPDGRHEAAVGQLLPKSEMLPPSSASPSSRHGLSTCRKTLRRLCAWRCECSLDCGPDDCDGT